MLTEAQDENSTHSMTEASVAEKQLLIIKAAVSGHAGQVAICLVLTVSGCW